MYQRQQIFLKIVFSVLFIIQINTQIHYQQYISIQQQYEIYLSYIPLIESCNYDSPNIEPGSVNITDLGANNFFQLVNTECQLIFWAPVTNGISISLLLEDNLPSHADGYILFNSAIKLENREVIIYEIDKAQNQIIFAYATVKANSQNLALTFTTNQIDKIQLDNQARSIVSKCGNMLNQSAYTIEFLGNNMYIYLCFENSNGFTFLVENNSTICQTIDFQNQNLTLPIIQAITNPEILIASNIIDNRVEDMSYSWNLQILSASTQGNFTYFCSFILESSNFTCSKSSEMIDEVLVIFDRLWGAQISVQEFKFLEFSSAYGDLFKGSFDFPGDINQVYISPNQNIFVESVNQNNSYLNIFDNEGQQMANISYNGSIVYYGTRNLVTYNGQTQLFQKIQINRPMYLISNQANETQSFTQQNVTIECSGNNIEIQYHILWSSPYYPSGLVIPYQKTRIFNSSTQVYGFSIKDQFLLIGPAFDTYINSTDDINSIIIQSSIIQIQNYFDAVVGIQFMESRVVRIFLATSAEIFVVTKDNFKEKIISKKPCGFTTIVAGQKLRDGDYIIVDKNHQKCLCTGTFSNCQIITQTDQYLQLSQSENKQSQNSLYNNYLDQSFGRHISNKLNLSIKKNIFVIFNEGYMLSILTNNSILLIDININQVTDSYTMVCKQQNSTQASVYMKQFYNPILLAYCYSSSFITQIIIRNSQLIFEREVPIYGFKTRMTQNSIQKGYNYVFLEVDSTTNRVPPRQQCCILRLDPCQYTVSFIQEIIQARQLIFVNSINRFDVAIFNQTKVTNTSSFLKIYFGDPWITLNYTNTSNPVKSQQFQVIFESFEYNFAAIFDSKISFNLSDLDLYIQPHDIPEIQLNTSLTKHGHEILSTAISYNYSMVCGPIFYSLAAQSANHTSQLQIYQADVITRTKVLGEIGVDFIQIIIPRNYDLPMANSSLNQLMLLVSTNQMFIYAIERYNISMYQVYRQNLTQQQCTYYVYQQLQPNLMTLLGNCKAPNFDQTYPVLTLSYQDGWATLQQSTVDVPFQLRDIYTILVPDQPAIVIGIAEGPIASKSGKLNICQKQICSSLYVSSKYQFLISYDAYGSSEFFIIIALDIQKLSVYIMPEIGVDQNITSNFTLNYSNFTGIEYCSVLNIFDANQTNIKIVLSCEKYYYYFYVDNQLKSMKVMKKFTRYSECAKQDRFEPNILKVDDEIGALFTVCNQNVATLKLQSFETINSSIPTIYTGYLQIFTYSGPQCNQNLSPIRVIPLSSSLDYPVFASYRIQNSSKFIYSQITGRLFDNNVNYEPIVYISYRPISVNYQIPDIKFIVFNPYDKEQQVYEMINIQPFSSSIGDKILFGCFCLFSVITIIFTVCAFITMKRRHIAYNLRSRQSGYSGFGVDLEFSDNLRAMRERFDSQPSNIRKTHRPSQIELFYIKSQ